jgi:hypothetical protein
MAASAICRGVTGTPGCFPTVSPAPVRAQVTITSEFMMLSKTFWPTADATSAAARLMPLVASRHSHAEIRHAPYRSEGTIPAPRFGRSAVGGLPAQAV